MSAANAAKLVAGDDRVNRHTETVVIIFQIVLHFRQKKFVRKLHLAAQSEAKQFFAELSHDIVFTLHQQVLAQPGETVYVLSTQ